MPSSEIVMPSRTSRSGSRKGAHPWNCDTYEMLPMIADSIGSIQTRYCRHAIWTSGCDKDGKDLHRQPKRGVGRPNSSSLTRASACGACSRLIDASRIWHRLGHACPKTQPL
jgi:hypothetical protein